MHKYRLGGVSELWDGLEAFAVQEYLVHLRVVDFAVIDSTMTSLIDAFPLASSVSLVFAFPYFLLSHSSGKAFFKS